MKRAMASALALAALTGMSAGRLLAKDQPAAKLFSVASTPSERSRRMVEAGYASAPDAPARSFAFSSAAAGTPARALSYDADDGPAGGPAGASPCGPAYATAGSCFSGAAADDGCDVPDGFLGGCCSPACRLKVAVGAAFLYRFASSRSSSRMLVQDFLTGEEVHNSQDVQAGWGTGPHVDVMYNLARRWNLELLYFGLDNWNRDHIVSSPELARFVVPVLSEQFLFNDVTSQYTSRLYNAEGNLRWHVAPHATTLIGFRFMELREKADMLATSEFGSAQATSTLTNNLYGLQIGGNLDFWDSSKRLHIKPLVKAGVFENQIARAAAQGGLFSEPSLLHDTGSHPGFVGEVGLMATYRLTHHFGAFAGAEAMWLTGLALAADNLGVVGTVHAEAHASFVGGLAGIQGKW